MVAVALLPAIYRRFIIVLLIEHELPTREHVDTLKLSCTPLSTIAFAAFWISYANTQPSSCLISSLVRSWRANSRSVVRIGKPCRP